MRALLAVLAVAAAVTVCGGQAGCSSTANAIDVKVGDCLELGGTAARPEVIKVACGSPTSNFRVAATVSDRDGCPTDVDFSYSRYRVFSSSAEIACLDIDWVVGDCMSVDPQTNTDPFRADCADRSVPHRQRATQILKGVVRVDQCASGLGYAYHQRRFTVCVEDVV